MVALLSHLDANATMEPEPRAAAPGHSRSERRKASPAQDRLGLATAALIFAGLVGSSLGVHELWGNANDDAVRNTHILGAVVADGTSRSLQAVSLVLKEMENDVQAEGVRTADDFRELLASQKLFHELAGRLRDLPQADALGIAGSDGKLVNFSRAWPPPNINLADRDYFEFCRGGSPGATYVSAPGISRASGDQVFYVARCVYGGDGSFLGVLMSVLQTRYFRDLYASVGLPDGMAVALRRTDGTLLAGYPDGSIPVGVPASSPWYRIVAQEQGDHRFAAVSSSVPGRFVSIAQLDNFPVVVDVSLSSEIAFARWRRQAWTIGAFMVLSLGCILLLLRALTAQFRRLEGSRASLRHRNRELQAAAIALQDSQAQLSRQSAALETTLEHMDQGLMMVTGEQIVAVCNKRAMEMLELPPELMNARPSFSAVLAEQWKREEFTCSPDPLKEFVRKGGILEQPHSYERQRPNGTWIQVHSVPLTEGGVVRTYSDITERKRAEEQLAYHAHHDELTGLANRLLYQQELERAIAAAGDGSSFGVLYLDLDRFKLVNDTRGHGVGDRLLVEVAARMRACLRQVDTVARLGGDEFAALLPNGVGKEEALSFAERLRQRLGDPYVIDGGISHIGVSIGIAIYPADGVDMDSLLRAADGALYRAKGAGRDTIRCHEEAAEATDREACLLEQELRRALDLEQFELCYQPIFHLGTGAPYSFEALLRWRHPTRGVIMPDEFMPIAEAIGIIPAVGRWVIRTACTEAATWALPVRLAINLSPSQFLEPDLEQQIGDILAGTGLPPERLDLEVTEGLLASETGQFRDTMHALRKRNIRLSLDDFGTAGSSLSKLQGFAFQQIKINRSFATAVQDDENSVALLQAVFNMALAMRLEVVVEGVATRAQLEILSGLGCAFVQGFMLGRPQSPEWTREYLWQWHTNRADTLGPLPERDLLKAF